MTAGKKRIPAMKVVSVFDPPQSCSTGACGPDRDEELARLASDLEWLSVRGVEVTRHNLGHDPGAFVRNSLVKSALDREGLGCLPMILIDGAIAKKGGYLMREDFARLLGLESASRAAPKAPATSEDRRKAS
jgi:hypothetical protein